MFSLFVRRMVSLGFVWLGTALPLATAVFAQESKQEHILFQAIRRGDTELLRGALRAGTPPDDRLYTKRSRPPPTAGKWV